MKNSPVWIYAFTVLFFLLVLFHIYNPGLHPSGEGKWIPMILFWIFDIATLLVGLVWWNDGKRFTGAIGLLLAPALALLMIFC